ncbi:MAG TPA: hypothetical protein VGS12_06200 [Caulobacteraceae bacterium]|nr:hypothetical protein [Caulobacteraceae bacterium]
MPVNTLDPAAEQAKEARSATDAALEHGQKAFAEAVSAAERTLSEAARTAERVFREGVDSLRNQTRAYTDDAGQRVEEAQKYVLERVRERPVTATLAGLGVGLLLGLLLSSRNK